MRVLDAAVALGNPLIPAVRTADRDDVVGGIVDSLEGHLVSGLERHLAATGGDRGPSVPDENLRVAVGVDVHSVVARLFHGQGRVGSVDLEDLVLVEIANVKRAHTRLD